MSNDREDFNTEWRACKVCGEHVGARGVAGVTFMATVDEDGELDEPLPGTYVRRDRRRRGKCGVGRVAA